MKPVLDSRIQYLEPGILVPLLVALWKSLWNRDLSTCVFTCVIISINIANKWQFPDINHEQRSFPATIYMNHFYLRCKNYKFNLEQSALNIKCRETFLNWNHFSITYQLKNQNNFSFISSVGFSRIVSLKWNKTNNSVTKWALHLCPSLSELKTLVWK